MRLLLDANISWRLAALLKPHFEDCQHVDQTGLPVPAKDLAIWNYAAANAMIIVTNDDDFLNLARLKGFPPKVVLLRTGNQSNDFILSLLIKYKQEIRTLQTATEIGVLEIF